MNLSELTGDEKLLAARLSDLISLSEKHGVARFSAFLNERQQGIASELARRSRCENCRFYGGFPDAVRRMFGVFPAWQQPEDDAFPVVHAVFRYPEASLPTHRDFLGAVLSLGIDRESVGDILPQSGRCDLFLAAPVAPFVTENLRKVGGTGVRYAAAEKGEVAFTQQFEELRGTVSSLRLDCIVALLTRLSREKSAALIEAGMVRQNHVPVQAVSRHCVSGDVFSIRGYGRFRLESAGAPTRKGRLPVVCLKYN